MSRITTTRQPSRSQPTWQVKKDKEKAMRIQGPNKKHTEVARSCPSSAMLEELEVVSAARFEKETISSSDHIVEKLELQPNKAKKKRKDSLSDTESPISFAKGKNAVKMRSLKNLKNYCTTFNSEKHKSAAPTSPVPLRNDKGRSPIMSLRNKISIQSRGNFNVPVKKRASQSELELEILREDVKGLRGELQTEVSKMDSHVGPEMYLSWQDLVRQHISLRVKIRALELKYRINEQDNDSRS